MSFLSEKDVALLEHHATNIRETIIRMLAHAKSGHTAGALGMADVFSALYFYLLDHDPENPEWEDRDRLILSNGHIVPVRYAAMAECGYFPYEEIFTLRAFDSRLQGHPERARLPGIETTSGPLGEGLSQAIGIALGARMDQKDFRTYCVMSDGEQQCGMVWEAVLFAGKEKLVNLTTIIDRNRIQISGDTETVMPLEPLHEKYESFGWHVIRINGNDVEMVCDAIEKAKQERKKPTVIIADTIPGRGVPEIEGRYEWHGKVPSDEQALAWIAALKGGEMVTK